MNRYVKKFLFKITKYLLKIKIFVYKNIISTNEANLNKSIINQPTQFVGEGLIDLNDVNIGIWPSPNFFNGVSYLEARKSSALLKIGKKTFLNNNSSIIVDKTSITIGDNCLIGPNFFATDSDFHGISLVDRINGEYKCMPIVIENNVFIGEGVKILKGVNIGEGAVIGSGSVVTKNVEPFSVVAGIPAKKIKNIKNNF